MICNEQAKCNEYSANSYINVLDQIIERCWQPGMTFMQDNAPIHTAKKVSKWFQEWAIPVLNWPLYSSDLNPIKHIWAKMKQ